MKRAQPHLHSYLKRVLCKRNIYSGFLFFFVDVKLVGLDELLGKTLIGALGNYIGDISGVEIEPTSWKVTYLQVKLSRSAAKEIGIKKSSIHQVSEFQHRS